MRGTYANHQATPLKTPHPCFNSTLAAQNQYCRTDHGPKTSQSRQSSPCNRHASRTPRLSSLLSAKGTGPGNVFRTRQPPARASNEDRNKQETRSAVCNSHKMTLFLESNTNAGSCRESSRSHPFNENPTPPGRNLLCPAPPLKAPFQPTRILHDGLALTHKGRLSPTL
jgi:hypothetical protein